MKRAKKSEIIENANEIYSSSKGKKGAKHAMPKDEAKSKKAKKIFFIVLASVLAFVVVVGAVGALYVNNLLGHLNKTDKFKEDDININSELDAALGGKDIVNIALFGIDTRYDTFKGRSDAVIILTIDRARNKIKMTSIARDSYVAIEDRDNDKLTHAYAYGGAQLAVQTLNENYDLNIRDYITVNFFGIVEVIDKLGGLEVDVDSSEKYVMNTEYVPELNRIGLPCDEITKTGVQHLTGAQALAYSRNRYSPGGDAARTARQREVLSLMFEKVKAQGLVKLDSIVRLAFENCETNLSNSDILSLAKWAITSSPTIESLSLPDEDCNVREGDDAFLVVNGKKVWYSIYDIDVAIQKIHDFIKEEGTYLEVKDVTSSN